MNDDQYFLANAYLDGELTDDERSIAEGDPAVMAEVEVLRGLQVDLRAVDAPTAAARESAIGAAMAEFAARDAAVATKAPAPVVPFRPRPAYSRLLGIAAAVVAVGVLGVVIVNSGGGGDNDDSMAEPAALEADAADDGGAESAADRDVAESVTPTDLENATAAVAAEEATGDAAVQMAESEMADDAMADEGAADEASAEMSAEASDVAATTPAGADVFRDVDVAYDTAARVTLERPDIDVDAPITNDAELGAYGSYLLELQNRSALPPTPNTDCDPTYNILAATTAIINDVETDVYIAVQEDDERVIGMDKRNCDELVDGPLFPPTDP